MSVHLDERAGGGFALYIDGDLQFDTADEALYHESLALPALCLSRPERPDGRRVLICGGGDGLALRECLRFPDIAEVDLVDRDPEVVTLGRTRFADLNRHAFEDARATVHLADAWEFLEDAPPYDVILCDFTVPRRPEDARVFTVEWYERVRRALAPGGVVALNAVSPQVTPEAFWCLRRTVRAAGLSALPYRVCIPSYRAHGYGVWAFLLAAPHPLRQLHLRDLSCPVAARQADLTRLWRGARFSRTQRRLEYRVPAHTLASGCLLPLLLNPGRLDPRLGRDGGYPPKVGGQTADGSSAMPRAPSPELPTTGYRLPSLLAESGEPFCLDALLRAIPILHPYHTRAMVETLAAQVAETVRALDLGRLVEALLRRAAELPRELIHELRRLRDFLRDRIARLEPLGAWGQRLFAVLVIVMTLANSIAPDNAFAKGARGLGHASISRGYSHSFASRGSFGREGGFGARPGETPGSFGRQGSFGVRPSEEMGAAGGFGSPAPSMRVTSPGFRRSYERGEPVDIYGNAYPSRLFRYTLDYLNNGGPASPGAPAVEERAVFAADDDMLVLANGDVAITLSDRAYLLASGGKLALMSQKSPRPLLSLYPDPELFQRIIAQVQEQQAVVEREIAARRDWLAWVGWTHALFSSVADDQAELRHLEDLRHRLAAAMTRVGQPAGPAASYSVTPQAVELFVGCYLMPDTRVAVRGAAREWLYTEGRRLWSDGPNAKAAPCPPELSASLQSVMLKLRKEFTADLASVDSDLRDLGSNRASLEKDLSDYQSIYATNGYQADYEVDYGTDSIPVSDALARTRRDIDQNQQDTERSMADRAKLTSDMERLGAALEQFGQ
jgi:spermidine synthase